MSENKPPEKLGPVEYPWWHYMSDVRQNLKRERINAFLKEVGINPNDVVSFECTAHEFRVTRYAINTDGSLQLDHLGPKLTETKFYI
jgi:hypothetical protein